MEKDIDMNMDMDTGMDMDVDFDMVLRRLVSLSYKNIW
jgi:hypothetical protein